MEIFWVRNFQQASNLWDIISMILGFGQFEDGLTYLCYLLKILCYFMDIESKAKFVSFDLFKLYVNEV